MPSAPAVNAEHLRTDHLVQNLGERALSSGLVTIAAQGIKFFLNLTSAAVLARLLTPKDFGLVGMVLAITGLLGLFKEAGLSTATVQSERITQDQVSNLFWLNVILGGVVCLTSVALSPLVAWFYNEPRLIRVMSLLSLTFVITSSTVQHQALMTRQMRFKALAIIDITSMLIGTLAGCCMALFGFRYWSLIGMQLGVAVVTLLLTWRTSGWHPTFPKRDSGVTPLVTLGFHLTAADLIGLLTVNSDGMLVGRFFGSQVLGLYSRASVLLSRPLQQVLTPISAVLIPVLSRLQSEPERYRRTFLRVYDGLALITFPFAALCLVLAQPLVLVILGPQWKGAIPLFAAFTLVAVSLPLSLMPSWLFMSQGRGRDQLHTYVAAGAVTVGAYVVGLRWGPLGVVLSLAVTSLIIRLPILYYFAGRCGPVRSSDLWKGFLSYLPTWLAAYIAALLGRSLVAQSAPIVQITLCVPLGAAAALAIMLALKRPRSTLVYAYRRIRHLAGTLIKASRARQGMPLASQEGADVFGSGSQHSGKRLRIALFGIFGVQNIGNECTLDAMLYNVRRWVSQADIYGICYEPDDTAKRYGLPAVPVRRTYTKRNPFAHAPGHVTMPIKILSTLLLRAPAELFEFLRAYKLLRRTRVMIMTGTGMLTDWSGTCFGYPYDIFKWTLAAKLAGCKVRFVGIGVGPIYHWLSKVLIKMALGLADYRSFRDSQSKARLENISFKAAKDPVFPDLAFSSRNIVGSSRRSQVARPTVGVGVMYYMDPHVSSTLDGQRECEVYLECMCTFISWLIEHGYSVRILQGDMKHDTRVRSDLKIALEARGLIYDRVGIIDEDVFCVDDLFAQLATVDIVVSARFHNLILALMLNKPVISISYDPKHDALLDGFGLGSYSQPINNIDVDKLIKQLLELEINSDRISPRISRRVEEYRRVLNDQYRLVLGEFCSDECGCGAECSTNIISRKAAVED